MNKREIAGSFAVLLVWLSLAALLLAIFTVLISKDSEYERVFDPALAKFFADNFGRRTACKTPSGASPTKIACGMRTYRQLSESGHLSGFCCTDVSPALLLLPTSTNKCRRCEGGTNAARSTASQTQEHCRCRTAQITPQIVAKPCLCSLWHMDKRRKEKGEFQHCHYHRDNQDADKRVSYGIGALFCRHSVSGVTGNLAQLARREDI